MRARDLVAREKALGKYVAPRSEPKPPRARAPEPPKPAPLPPPPEPPRTSMSMIDAAIVRARAKLTAKG